MRFPRVRIVGVMILIGGGALNLGAVRAIPRFTSPNPLPWTPIPMPGLGGLPMLNALAIGLLIARRWPGSRPFMLGFAGFGITVLSLYTAGVILFPGEFVMPFRNRVMLPLAYVFAGGPYASRTGELLLVFLL